MGSVILVSWRVYLGLSRTWVRGDRGVPLLWGLQSEQLGTMLVSNGLGGVSVWVTPRLGDTAAHNTETLLSESLLYARPCPGSSACAI